MPATKPFTALMLSSEFTMLCDLYAMLEHDRISTRDEFMDLMNAAFKHGKLDPRALADDLAHSISAVYRWIEGTSAPHPSLWPTIIAWIMAALKVRIDETKPKGMKKIGR